jgi:hypothetical protein
MTEVDCSTTLFEQNLNIFFSFYAINVTYLGDLCFSKLPLSLNWFNLHQIALLTGGYLPFVWQSAPHC